MKKFYLFLLSLLLAGPAFSQQFAIDTVYFEFDQHQLSEASKATLDSLVARFVDYPNYYVEIFGHTDSSGTDEYNLRLSELRAREVAIYMMNHGVMVERVVYEGLGTTKPAASNATYRGRRVNRRTDIAVLFTNDRLPLPEPPVDSSKLIAIPVVTIDPASLIDTIYCDYATFPVKANKSYRIIAPKGTEILLPANAFVSETGELTVEVKEMFRTSEFLLAQMPLISKDGPLESQGMMSFTVNDGRRPADVVEGSIFEVRLPVTRREDNIAVYKGTGGGRGGRRRGAGGREIEPAEDPAFAAVTRWVEEDGTKVDYNGKEKKYTFQVAEPARYSVGRMLYYPMNAERDDKGFDFTVKFKGRLYPKTVQAMMAGENVRTTIPLKKEDDRVYTADKVKFVNDKAPMILFALQYDEDGNPWVVNYVFRVADYAKKGRGKKALPTVTLKVKFKKVTEEELAEIMVDLDN